MVLQFRLRSLLLLVLIIGLTLGFVLNLLALRRANATVVALQAELSKFSPSPPYVDVGRFVVNLKEPTLIYLSIHVSVHSKPNQHQQLSAAVERNRAKLKSRLTAKLVGLTVKDVQGDEGFRRVQKEMLEEISTALEMPTGEASPIAEVLVEELQIQ